MTRVCPTCSGRGWKAKLNARSTGARGYASKVTCARCNGTGLRREKVEISMPVESNDR